MKEANPNRGFGRYGRSMGSIKVSELRDMQDVRAETADSGCEGMYCEVAKWNERKKRWERFAYQKFFGNDEMSEHEEADMYTQYINKGWCHQGFVHDMVDYSEEPA